MARIELTPDLSNCIKTVARREYDNLVSDYLQTGEKAQGFEEKIELLRTFLESADFKKLRSESEKHLLKGQNIKFILHQEDNEAKWELKIES